MKIKILTKLFYKKKKNSLISTWMEKMKATTLLHFDSDILNKNCNYYCCQFIFCTAKIIQSITFDTGGKMTEKDPNVLKTYHNI